MRKRWKGGWAARTDAKLKRARCCKKLQVPPTLYHYFLRSKAAKLIDLGSAQRRSVLFDMLGSNGKFLFGGRRLCAIFLVDDFRFSRDLQSSVRQK